MTSSITVAFTGKESVLRAYFSPDISFSEEYDYSCTFLDLIIQNSTNLDSILQLNEIRVNCDIISESYINGTRGHTIHQFTPSTSTVKGVSLVERPKHLNYFPVKIRDLYTIQISLVDHTGKLVDLKGGNLICRIKINRDWK